MKKLSLIIISTLLCLTVKSQSNKKPAQSFIKIDSKTHILKNDYEIIIVTNDSLVVNKVKESNLSYELFACHDSSKGKSTMIWLGLDDQIKVEELFMIESPIYVEMLEK